MTSPLPLVLPHDIIEPAPIGWWPLAPGWWLLLAVLVLACALLIRWAWRRRRALAPMRQALRELTQIQTDWQQHRNNRDAMAALSALLKRTARWRYPEDDPAALSGQHWQAFLLRTGAGAFTDTAAATLAVFYQHPTISVDEPPFAACQQWLKAQAGKKIPTGLRHD